MFNKIYEKIKQNIIEIIIVIVVVSLSLIPLPYYIEMPGGLLNTKNRVEIENSYEVKGSFNLAYVSEMKATPILYILALIRKDWDIVKERDITYDNQTIEEMHLYDRLLLENSSNNAKLIAYQKANKSVTISESKLIVAYISNDANTNLRVGDTITKIDDKYVTSLGSFKEYIKNLKENDIINFTVVDKNNNMLNKTATVKMIENELLIGISILNSNVIETDPPCKLSFENKESGPSGGLMTALTIYNYLVEKDITHGYVISGTGTIEEDGSVGEIGGVKYKLKGVVDKKADIFLVPAGDNYEEAIRLKEANKYEIKIVPIETFDDALEYLNNLK